MKYLGVAILATGVVLIGDSGPTDIARYIGCALVGVYVMMAWGND